MLPTFAHFLPGEVSINAPGRASAQADGQDIAAFTPVNFKGIKSEQSCEVGVIVIYFFAYVAHGPRPVAYVIKATIQVPFVIHDESVYGLGDAEIGHGRWKLLYFKPMIKKLPKKLRFDL
jgi:hypothetical protein